MGHEPSSYLVIEVLGVAVIVILALAVSQGVWWMGPSVLTAGALLPMAIRGRPLVRLGLRVGPLRRSAGYLCLGGVLLVCLGIGGVILLKHLGLSVPLGASGQGTTDGSRVLFHFGYAAFPEELFFRGYLLHGLSGEGRKVLRYSRRSTETISVIVSAGIFALAHVVVLRNVGAILTFVPGLIFGWSFVRSKSLIVPVVLHGMANLSYVSIIQPTVYGYHL